MFHVRRKKNNTLDFIQGRFEGEAWKCGEGNGSICFCMYHMSVVISFTQRALGGKKTCYPLEMKSGSPLAMMGLHSAHQRHQTPFSLETNDFCWMHDWPFPKDWMGYSIPLCTAVGSGWGLDGNIVGFWQGETRTGCHSSEMSAFVLLSASPITQRPPSALWQSMFPTWWRRRAILVWIQFCQLCPQLGGTNPTESVLRTL